MQASVTCKTLYRSLSAARVSAQASYEETRCAVHLGQQLLPFEAAGGTPAGKFRTNKQRILFKSAARPPAGPVGVTHVRKTVVFGSGAVVPGVGAPGHLNRVSKPVSKSTCQNCGMSLSSGTFATRPVGHLAGR